MKKSVLIGLSCFFCLTWFFGVGSVNAAAGEMSYIDNGQVRVGIDLTIGGSINYLADSKTGENVVNSHDWGRQVQMSFYSGPNPYVPEGATVRPAWEKLGWNPIQSGDCFANESKVLEHRNDGHSIYVKCRPMHWPLDNVPGECTFEVWITLDGRAVRIKSRLNNTRANDKTQYRGRSQELPAVYTNGPYHKLMTYTGNNPFTGDQMVEIPKKVRKPGDFLWSHFQGTENWAALVNEDNFGLGVWNPGVYKFIGGFAGVPGRGGTKDSPTGYIAPLHIDILDWNIVYDYEYILILDTLDKIRTYVYDHAAKSGLPTYVFEADRQHWIHHNARDHWPIERFLDIHAIDSKKRPQLFGPADLWHAEHSHKLMVEAAVKKRDTNNTIATGRMYWSVKGQKGFDFKRSIEVSIPADGKFHTVTVEIGHTPAYKGVVSGLRYDPFSAVQKGDWIKIKSIAIQ